MPVYVESTAIPKLYVGTTEITKAYVGTTEVYTSSRPWTPADITTALWLDASDTSTITASSNAVSQWNDKSGNGLNFIQATSINQPATNTRTINGLNVIDFDGSNDFLSRSGGALARNLSSAQLFLVRQWDAFSGVNLLFQVSTSDNPNVSIVQVGANRTASRDYAGGRRTNGDTLARIDWTANSSTSTAQIMNMWWDWQNTTVAIGLDGASAATNTSFQTAGSTTDANAQGASIGANLDNASFSNAAIGELVYCKTKLSSTDAQKVEGYLAWKWGLVSSLPAGHPYKSAAPVV